MRPPIDIHTAEAGDAPVLAELCCQLGYPVTPEEVRGYLQPHPGQAGRSLLVAHWDSVPVGWLEVWAREALEGGRWAEISGLVVEAAHRRRGIGEALVQAARAWAQGQGLTRLRVRTRVDREGAARFYLSAGFVLTKQQRVYDMALE